MRSAAACFLTARAMEQIKVDAAYSQHHMVLVGQSPGMAYGELGPTHHSIEDLAWLRTIPGLTVLVPTDPTDTAQAVRWAATAGRPVFIRVSRMGVPDVMTALNTGRIDACYGSPLSTVALQWYTKVKYAMSMPTVSLRIRSSAC